MPELGSPKDFLQFLTPRALFLGPNATSMFKASTWPRWHSSKHPIWRMLQSLLTRLSTRPVAWPADTVLPSWTYIAGVRHRGPGQAMRKGTDKDWEQRAGCMTFPDAVAKAGGRHFAGGPSGEPEKKTIPYRYPRCVGSFFFLSLLYRSPRKKTSQKGSDLGFPFCRCLMFSTCQEHMWWTAC